MHAICALYKFTRLDDFETIQLPLKGFLDSLSVKGTLLLAREGINGTISGNQASLEKVLEYLQSDSRFLGLEYKFSYSKKTCLLYTSPSPRDRQKSRMPSSA